MAALLQKEINYAKDESNKSKRSLKRIFSFAFDWKQINDTIIKAMEARNKNKLCKYKKFVMDKYE
jgi:hypothetical protein